MRQCNVTAALTGVSGDTWQGKSSAQTGSRLRALDLMRLPNL